MKRRTMHSNTKSSNVNITRSCKAMLVTRGCLPHGCLHIILSAAGLLLPTVEINILLLSALQWRHLRILACSKIFVEKRIAENHMQNRM